METYTRVAVRKDEVRRPELGLADRGAAHSVIRDAISIMRETARLQSQAASFSDIAPTAVSRLSFVRTPGDSYGELFRVL